MAQKRNRLHEGRFTADMEGDFVVFLIGSVAHKPWKLRKWVPIAKAMGAMQREIAEHPEIGCLAIENFGAMRNVSVQYWRSFEHLERYARSDEWAHLGAWRNFNRVIAKSSDVGIWHETYRVGAGEYETMYGNLGEMGLARAGRHTPIARTSTAATRLAVRSEDRAPVDAY